MRSLRRFVTALMTAALLGSVLGVVPAVAVEGDHGITVSKDGLVGGAEDGEALRPK